MGAGATGVWVQVLDVATHTLTHYLHSGLAGQRDMLWSFILFNCTVLQIYQTLPKTSAALHLKHFQYHGLYQAVVIKMADKVE